MTTSEFRMLLIEKVKFRRMKNYIENMNVFALLLISMYVCKAQNISDKERLSYTLKNFEHCLFYSDQLSKEEGINIRKLNCEGYHVYYE